MAVSFDYVTRETASNLWRNRLMTLAAVLTVAVSLIGAPFTVPLIVAVPGVTLDRRVAVYDPLPLSRTGPRTPSVAER